MRDRDVDGDRVTVHIRAVMRRGAERKSIFIQILRVVDQGLDQIGAAHIVRQIAVKMAAERIVAKILNDAAAVRVGVRFVELIFGSVGKTLRQNRQDCVDPKRIYNRLMGQDGISARVKVAVAIALGLGTMVGWKRIVVTVGEKIGKTHLTYGQGAAAELVAAGTIAAADMYGLPVSTTHVLSSGVAGTMAANGSGLQMSTLGNIALAWVLTLPMAMMLSGGLYILFLHLF